GHRLRKVVASTLPGRQKIAARRLVGRLLEEFRGHVPSEDRLARAALIIDLPDRLRLVGVERESVLDEAAGVVGPRQLGGDRQRCRAELPWIDPVVVEGRAERDLASTVARRRGKRREITGEHLRGRYERAVIAGHLPAVGALITAEEEHLVGPDRAGLCGDVLVSIQPVVP